MSDTIRFYYQDQVHTVDSVSPTKTVLQYLREDLHCTGSKEGCAEGDCGACTVVIGELVDGAVRMQAINSCIQFLPVLDGKALFTIEDLKQPDGSLHPVQQALVECHASQCGFCTPGFAMSLWSLYLDSVHHAGQTIRPERRRINETLSGNLCRCTGYRPIIAAAQRMGELPEVIFDRIALGNQLQAIRRSEMLVYQQGGQTFYAPRTLKQLLEVRAARPLACLLSGSTDVGLWVTKQLRDLGDIISVRHVAELAGIREQDGQIEIGAAVTLTDAYRAIARHYPELGEMAQRFASLPVRNAGTLGGNVANGSPIGDSAPWLIALGADIVLHGVDGRRTMLLEAFYLDYMKNDLRPTEIVEAIRIPAPRPGQQFRSYKLAKRYDQDISAVCAAFAITLEHNIVQHAHIAFGGMAATSRRAPKTEAALNGQPWNEATLLSAMQMLTQDYTPLTDLRASDSYRMQAAQNLLRRFWLETGSTAGDVPLSVHAVMASGQAALP